MRIALDFDGTVTEDEILWVRFCAMAKERGHYVAIVTARSPHSDNRDVELFQAQAGVSAIFTSGEPKRRHFKADVWIDDMPEMIVEHSGGGILVTGPLDYLIQFRKRNDDA